MKLLLCYLIFGYLPKWKIIEQRPLASKWKGETIEQGIRYVLQCEQTGNVKFKDVI